MAAPKKGKDDKKEHHEEKQWLGKPEKNKCRIGIVGLPNIGKSSFFNVLSSKQVAAENYPFCTIKPSLTQVAVPDKRWVHLCESFKPKSRVQAILEVWDIAGLVRGAHEGKGLGNEFLANIQAVDAIYHVVRAFRAKDVEHVEGTLDPVRDIQIIANELRQKDIALLQKKYDSLSKLVTRTKDKRVKDEFVIVERLLALLKEGKDIAFCGERFEGKYLDYISSYNLFTAKPVTFLVNVSESNWLKGQNKFIADIQAHVAKVYPGSSVIPFSAAFEKKISEMPAEESEAFLEKNSTKSVINKIITQGYKCLQLIHFFTCGEDEVRCWTVRKGAKAPQAAGTIHSDMEVGFICAEVYAYKDFKKSGGTELSVKSAGKYQQHGKTYVVQDGDVCFFKFNKPQPAKKK
eukprot:CAMPEP_0202691174 /NCGR_PEP_ID=MMETSP1385-20130828/5960_1 /ASSEMBLY_ACC=CAM_ASM_000861 /TAXON_ID=933848 /ORGANISM="Elphidium margaritaceum" /LENGTH=403 /DNA_ID=CAMNT_0049346535 /DNA_START=59 /DNA_END=1270 /DNA_ORIENTATION=+